MDRQEIITQIVLRKLKAPTDSPNPLKKKKKKKKKKCPALPHYYSISGHQGLGIYHEMATPEGARKVTNFLDDKKNFFYLTYQILTSSEK